MIKKNIQKEILLISNEKKNEFCVKESSQRTRISNFQTCLEKKTIFLSSVYFGKNNMKMLTVRSFCPLYIRIPSHQTLN